MGRNEGYHLSHSPYNSRIYHFSVILSPFTNTEVIQTVEHWHINNFMFQSEAAYSWVLQIIWLCWNKLCIVLFRRPGLEKPS